MNRVADSLMKLIHFAAKYIFALFSCAYLFLLGFMVRKNRDLISQIGSHFGYGRDREVPVLPVLPQAALSDVVKEIHPIRVYDPEYRNGNVSVLELVTINQLIKQHMPISLFELGTFDGRTTLNMAANSPENACVYTIDLLRAAMHDTKLALVPKEKALVDKSCSGERFRETSLASKITQLYGDTAKFDFSPYFDLCDFVFIDASHAYEYVLNDSMVALRLLRKGKGVVLWHDYNGWPGVTRALNELYISKAVFKKLCWVKDTNLAYLNLP